MFARIRPHLSYSNVMVTLLAVIVLGGGAVAFGGVVDKQGRISACYVKQGKHKGAVRLLVSGRCTRTEKLVKWNQRGLPGATGTPGQPGARGETGPPGSPSQLGGGSVGGSELKGFVRREGTAVVTGGVVGNDIWNHNTATASCLPGEKLVAGNAAWDDEAGGDPMAIVEIVPDFATNAVAVKGATDTAANRTLRAIAICAP